MQRSVSLLTAENQELWIPVDTRYDWNNYCGSELKYAPEFPFLALGHVNIYIDRAGYYKYTSCLKTFVSEHIF